jgi:hypothetical protein
LLLLGREGAPKAEVNAKHSEEAGADLGALYSIKSLISGDIDPAVVTAIGSQITESLKLASPVKNGPGRAIASQFKKRFMKDH